ncbi:MAG: L,D-transpeptidase [Marmoricola sp.]
MPRSRRGGFRWISDNELRWRPAKFWHAGTKVTVKANVGGVPAGNGIFGQTDRTLRFNIGRSLISRVNIETHQMRVFKNGKLINTIPITTGRQPEHTTRSGVKLIMEKYRTKDMNSETIGIDPDSADGYDLSGVDLLRGSPRLVSSSTRLHGRLDPKDMPTSATDARG